jgi:hypothetical protein
MVLCSLRIVDGLDATAVRRTFIATSVVLASALKVTSLVKANKPEMKAFHT